MFRTIESLASNFTYGPTPHLSHGTYVYITQYLTRTITQHDVVCSIGKKQWFGQISDKLTPQTKLINDMSVPVDQKNLLEEKGESTHVPIYLTDIIGCLVLNGRWV